MTNKIPVATAALPPRARPSLREASPLLEESLDPADWGESRRLAHRILDRILEFHREVRDRPVWERVPAELEARFLEGPPREGMGTEGALADFESLVLPYPVGNIHPRFWGWACGNGSPTGILAAAMAAALNPVAGVFDDSSSRVEAQLLSWMKAVFGFPSGASGILTSGGSVANLVGLAVAREAAVGPERTHGGMAEGPPLTLLASREVHGSVLKAAKLMGLGEAAVRLIPVDGAFRIRLPELREALRRDREEGFRPFALVGTAGTINTGAVDPLDAMADLAAEEGLWFHVDAAFGAAAALSPETRALVTGMERGDSLAFDFHKWMQAPYEAGCILIRDADAHRRAFSVGAEYLRPLERGPSRQPDSTNLRGPQLSRGFNALKVWLSLKEHGFEKYGRLVAQNVRQAHHLGRLIDASPLFQRVAPVNLNVVAFRHQPSGLDGQTADGINRELLMRIQESGVAVPSATLLDGRFTLRACLCGHRSRMGDVDLFLAEAERILREVRSDLGVAEG